MRAGLDFAWSRPSVADILAAGYTFVCRYLSYDDTGKNLTKAEADSYLAAGIGVCSNWEYATQAPLNGYGQGVRDATEGLKQHKACGGDSAAPIYFSVDFDVTLAQQPVVNEYLRGAASVLGLPRVGAYGGYYFIKRAFDAGVITYGWQTYAWSGGQWDPRVHVRQVLNGINVGGADCDRNEAQRDYFGQWFGTTTGDGMTPDEHNLLLYAAWRQDAAYSGSLVIRGGPDAGQPYVLNVTLKAISDKLAGLEAKVDAIGGNTTVVMTEAQIKAAMRAELDKTKLAGTA